MLKLHKFVFNDFGENTYILFDEDTKESAIVDPGCSNEQEENELSQYIESKGLKVKYLLNTHCHIDHILGNNYVKSKYNPVFIIPEKDEFLVDLMKDQARNFGIEFKPFPKPDKFFSEKEKLYLGELEIIPLFTPGHSPGEYCLYNDEFKICITGDVLFEGGVGRTDLWKGDYDTLVHSIQTKLYTLADDVKIFPGHGNSSTIGYEKRNNPFIKS